MRKKKTAITQWCMSKGDLRVPKPTKSITFRVAFELRCAYINFCTNALLDGFKSAHMVVMADEEAPIRHIDKCEERALHLSLRVCLRVCVRVRFQFRWLHVMTWKSTKSKGFSRID